MKKNSHIDDNSYAIDSRGLVVNVKSVARGLACDCFCPGCGAKLEAVQPERDIRPHFRHHNAAGSSEGCSDPQGASETLLHLKTKEIIASFKSAYLPEFCAGGGLWKSKRYPSCLLFDTYLWKFNQCNVEDRSIKNSERIPDISIATEKGMLAIEVKVRHKVDADKAQELHDLGFFVLEIDVSDMTVEELGVTPVSQRLHSSKYSKWLSFPLNEEQRNLLDNHIQEHKKLIDQKLQREQQQEQLKVIAIAKNEAVEKERIRLRQIEIEIPRVSYALRQLTSGYILDRIKDCKDLAPKDFLEKRVEIFSRLREISELIDSTISPAPESQIDQILNSGFSRDDIGCVLDYGVKIIQKRLSAYRKEKAFQLTQSFMKTQANLHAQALWELGWDWRSNWDWRGYSPISNDQKDSQKYLEKTFYPALNKAINEMCINEVNK